MSSSDRLSGGRRVIIIELNRIVARLAKFSRSEIRKLRRRIRSESGRAGDQQAVLAYISLLSLLSLLNDSDKPVVPTPEETLDYHSPSS
jgi:hypothetical protein